MEELPCCISAVTYLNIKDCFETVCRMTDYSVVEFLEEQAVECVPTSWLDIDKRRAYWPGFISRVRILKCVKSRLPPDDSWKLFAVRVIGTAGSVHLSL